MRKLFLILLAVVVMSVDTVGLNNALEQKGDVVFCGVNNDISYIVVVENVTEPIDSLTTIVDQYLSSEYPNQTEVRLDNGVFKCERTK
jgi:hypothetical protein